MRDKFNKFTARYFLYLPSQRSKEKFKKSPDNNWKTYLKERGEQRIRDGEYERDGPSSDFKKTWLKV